MKIIITENQLRLIKEAAGVPENILNEARVLYNIVKDKLKEKYNMEADIVVASLTP